MEDIEEYNLEEVNEEFHSTVLSDFLHTIKKYKSLSVSEQKELGRKMLNGDDAAREKLINHNYSLVVWRAYKKRDVLKSLEIMDIVQEGILGLIRACETYDPELGAFTTYAMSWIDQAIDRAINNKDTNIRVAVHVKDRIKKFNKYTAEYINKYGTSPSEAEVCKELGLTESQYNNMIHTMNQTETSLDAQVKDDSETELNNFIPFEETGYEDIINSLSSKSFFESLRYYFTDKEYYIIYYRFLSENRRTLEELSKVFFVTRERIRQIEVKALRKIKHIYESETAKNKLYVDTKASGFTYKAKPISVNNLVLYYYIEKKLTPLERSIFKIKLLDKRDLSNVGIAYQLGISEDTLNEALLKIKSLILSSKESKERFNTFKQTLMKTKGLQILNINLKENDDTMDIRNEFERAINLSFDDLSNEYDLSTLSIKEYELLKKYFEYPTKEYWQGKKTDTDIFISITGYKNYHLSLEPSALYKAYKDNEEEFSEEQRLFLESFYFKKRPYSEYIKKYPSASLRYAYDFIVKRIELFHYHLSDLKFNSFNKRKYLVVKEKYGHLLTQERIQMLDMYYGVNTKKHTVKEISEYFGYEYTHTNDLVSDARNRCILLYNDRYQKVDIDRKKYIPILLKGVVTFTKENEEILKEFIIENKSYEELSKIHNLSKTRISNIITENIRKLDEYYYGLTPINYENRDDILACLDAYNYSGMRRQIVLDRKLNGLTAEEAAKKYNKSNIDINRLIRRFNANYDTFITKDVEIPLSMIKSELAKEEFESILTEKEKMALALRLGIITIHNPKGKKLAYKEISPYIGSEKSTSYQVIHDALVKLKLVNMGYLKHNLIFISKEEMIKHLNDPHLPISDKEKDIIRKIYGINENRLTLDAIADIYNEKKGSILRRYKRSIISIKKYQNKEIQGIINYEVDIIPKLKYFSKFDREVLGYIYRDKMSLESIGKIYSLTFNQMLSISNRLIQTLGEILENKDADKFDFDYFDSVIDNDDIPYTGNKELVKVILCHYYGHYGEPPKGIPEIKKLLGMENVNASNISSAISYLMLAVCKYKDGIKLKPLPSYDDIKSYYEKYRDILDKGDTKAFLTYFKRVQKRSIGEDIIIPNGQVIFALAKEASPDLLDYRNMTKENALKILYTYGKVLSPSTRNTLQHYFEIPNKDLMSSKEKIKVRRMVELLIINRVKGETLKREND